MYFFKNFSKNEATSDFGDIRTGDTWLTGQGPNQYTKNLKIIFSELITEFKSST